MVSHMKKYLYAAIAICGVANAGTCRWTENGTTHFSEKCPPGVTVEERRHGGTVPLNETPAPSLIIQQGERAQARIEAREAASRARGEKWRQEAQIEKINKQESVRIDQLKKQAGGDGFPQSWDEARRRRQARDELDNINRQRAGLPPKSDLERRVDRLEKQQRYDRLQNDTELEEIRRKQ
jgi:hypothetical protein